MKEIQDGTLYDTELNENGAVFSGLEALYEFNLDDETNKLGVKLGVDVFGHNDLKVTTPLAWVKWTETTYAIPLTVYYKRDNGVSAWAPYVGAGVSFFRSELKVEFSGDVKLFRILWPGQNTDLPNCLPWAWKPNTILGQKLKKTERSIPIIRV